MSNILQALAASASGVDVDTHKKFLDMEGGQGFTTEQQGGAEFILEMVGLGTGATIAKKIGESSGKLPEGYNRNPDGTINGPGDGTLIDTGFQNDGHTVYQRVGENGPGGYFTIGNDNLQKPVESPRPKTEIGERRKFHNSKVGDIGSEFESKGGLVLYDGSITGNCGTTCKPDIFHMSQNGNVNFVEVKTGSAGLSVNQSKVLEQVGVDKSGKPQYRIPPDAIPSGKLMNLLDAEAGATLAELGYTNGIPVKIEKTEGLGD